MKLKQVITSVCVVAMIGAIATTAFAATSASSDAGRGFGIQKLDRANLTDEQKAELEAKRAEMTANRPEMTALTDEQKAEMEAKKAEVQAAMEAQSAKWAALSDAQKEEIYALKDQAIDAEIQVIDKYLALGLIDDAAATKTKTALNDRKAEMRTDGRLPMFGGMGGGFEGKLGEFGGKGFRGAFFEKDGSSEKTE